MKKKKQIKEESDIYSKINIILLFTKIRIF